MSAPPYFDAPALARTLFVELRLPRDAEFAVAYSGGMDSHVLLHALAELRAASGVRLRALHFDHGFNPDSAAWALHCEQICHDLDVEFLSCRRTTDKLPGENLEAFAREQRYRWFTEIMASGQILLTAHHMNDQAETVLLQLLRGGGVESLSGIRALRNLSAAKSLSVARPLLAFPRAALAEYARQHKLQWIEDPANRRAEFDRNYIRRKVMPVLARRWPGAPGSLVATAAQCGEAAAVVAESGREIVRSCQRAARAGLLDLAPPLAVAELQRFNQFQIFTALRTWLHRRNFRSPSRGQLRTFYQQVFMRDCGRARLRWGQLEMRVFRGFIHLIGARTADRRAAPDWELRPQVLRDCGLRIEIQRRENCQLGAPTQTPRARPDLDAARLRGKTIRWAFRVGGERMTLPGRAHSHKLKKLFQSYRVPPWERDALPLLMVDGEVAWAHRVGASAGYAYRASAQGHNIGRALRPQFSRGG